MLIIPFTGGSCSYYFSAKCFGNIRHNTLLMINMGLLHKVLKQDTVPSLPTVPPMERDAGGAGLLPASGFCTGGRGTGPKKPNKNKFTFSSLIKRIKDIFNKIQNNNILLSLIFLMISGITLYLPIYLNLDPNNTLITKHFIDIFSTFFFISLMGSLYFLFKSLPETAQMFIINFIPSGLYAGAIVSRSYPDPDSDSDQNQDSNSDTDSDSS